MVPGPTEGTVDSGGVDSTSVPDSSGDIPAEAAPGPDIGRVCPIPKGAPTDDEGTGCNALTHLAPWVDSRADRGSIPDGKGGAIEDGTYVLRAVDAYQGTTAYPPTGPTGRIRQTLVLRGGCFETIYSVSETVGYHASGPYFTEGALFHAHYACPDWAEDVFHWDASKDALVLYHHAAYGSGVAYRLDRVGD